MRVEINLSAGDGTGKPLGTVGREASRQLVGDVFGVVVRCVHWATEKRRPIDRREYLASPSCHMIDDSRRAIVRQNPRLKDCLLVNLSGQRGGAGVPSLGMLGAKLAEWAQELAGSGEVPAEQSMIVGLVQVVAEHLGIDV